MLTKNSKNACQSNVRNEIWMLIKYNKTLLNRNLHGKVVLNLFFRRFSDSFPTVHGTPGSSPYGMDCINASIRNKGVLTKLCLQRLHKVR